MLNWESWMSNQSSEFYFFLYAFSAGCSIIIFFFLVILWFSLVLLQLLWFTGTALVMCIYDLKRWQQPQVVSAQCIWDGLREGQYLLLLWYVSGLKRHKLVTFREKRCSTSAQQASQEKGEWTVTNNLIFFLTVQRHSEYEARFAGAAWGVLAVLIVEVSSFLPRQFMEFDLCWVIWGGWMFSFQEMRTGFSICNQLSWDGKLFVALLLLFFICLKNYYRLSLSCVLRLSCWFS